MMRPRLFDDEIDAGRVEVAAIILQESPRAFKLDTGDRVIWVPKSQMRYDGERKIALIADWLVKQEKLI